MKLRFTKNIALNTIASENSKLADFYKNLGFDSEQYASDFTVLRPAEFSCYVVSWEPKPVNKAEICLQFETDDIEEVKKRILEKSGEVISYGDDPNADGKKTLWFRDPTGNLINVVEI